MIRARETFETYLTRVRFDSRMASFVPWQLIRSPEPPITVWVRALERLFSRMLAHVHFQVWIARVGRAAIEWTREYFLHATCFPFWAWYNLFRLIETGYRTCLLACSQLMATRCPSRDRNGFDGWCWAVQVIGTINVRKDFFAWIRISKRWAVDWTVQSIAVGKLVHCPVVTVGPVVIGPFLTAWPIGVQFSVQILVD